MNSADTSKIIDEPVTVLVTRRPIVGKEQEFERYITGITEDALVQPGHMGSTIFRPSGGLDRTYRILFRFDTRGNLDLWEKSAIREKWRQVAAEVSEPREVEEKTGLDTWFTLPHCDVTNHPPKYKMALVIWLAIFIIVSTLSFSLLPFIAHWPMLLRTLLFTGIVVYLMTWIVMPLLTKWFAGWLYPGK